jgi:hypothetical protein
MDKYLQHLRIWSNKLFFQNVPITIHDKLPTKAGTVVVVSVWYFDLKFKKKRDKLQLKSENKVKLN